MIIGSTPPNSFYNSKANSTNRNLAKALLTVPCATTQTHHPAAIPNMQNVMFCA
jgi:hypothetical protein